MENRAPETRMDRGEDLHFAFDAYRWGRKECKNKNLLKLVWFSLFRQSIPRSKWVYFYSLSTVTLYPRKLLCLDLQLANRLNLTFDWQVYIHKEFRCFYCDELCDREFLECKVCPRLFHTMCLYRRGHLNNLKVPLKLEWTCYDCVSIYSDHHTLGPSYSKNFQVSVSVQSVNWTRTGTPRNFTFSSPSVWWSLRTMLSKRTSLKIIKLEILI